MNVQAHDHLCLRTRRNRLLLLLLTLLSISLTILPGDAIRAAEAKERGAELAVDSDDRTKPRTPVPAKVSLPGELAPISFRGEAAKDFPKVIAVVGPFGKVEINVSFPSLALLYLRGSDRLDAQSLLAQQAVRAYPGYRLGSGVRRWATGSYTYVVGSDNRRYESRFAAPEKVALTDDAGRRTVQIIGVKLAADEGRDVVATEDWTLSVPGDGSQLVWQIKRQWNRDFTCVMSGSPGMFFSFDARTLTNSATSTIWYDPIRLAAWQSDLYALVRGEEVVQLRGVSQNHVQTIRDRNTWAIYKLWTNWHARSDLRLEVEGGHLYRRGSFAFLSEAGAVTTCQSAERERAHRDTRGRRLPDHCPVGRVIQFSFPRDVLGSPPRQHA